MSHEAEHELADEAWYNDGPPERTSGGASTSGRASDDYELLELPPPTNVRCGGHDMLCMHAAASAWSKQPPITGRCE